MRKPREIDRRHLLRASGLLLAGAAAAACTPVTQGDPLNAAQKHPATAERPDSPPDPPAAVPGPPPRAAVVQEFSHLVPQEWGMEVSGTVTSVTAGVALTFDACGGPHGSGFDHSILDLLLREEVPATMFLNSRWIEANRTLARDLAEVPFLLLANHGTEHRPLSVTGRSAYGISGTRDVGEVYDEVTINHEVLGSLTGTPPGFFRAGTAHMDEVATAVVRRVGEVPVNFTVNVDAGATASAEQVAAAVVGAGDGDICLAHINQPSSPASAGWARALPRLLDSGLRLGTLADLGPVDR